MLVLTVLPASPRGGYGMPSDHAQFTFFCATFWVYLLMWRGVKVYSDICARRRGKDGRERMNSVDTVFSADLFDAPTVSIRLCEGSIMHSSVSMTIILFCMCLEILSIHSSAIFNASAFRIVRIVAADRAECFSAICTMQRHWCCYRCLFTV